jgi:osmotically-inducible protein OsmY
VAAILAASAVLADIPPVQAATTKTGGDMQILAESNSRVLDAQAGYFLGIEIDIVKGDVLLTGRVGDPQEKTRAAALIRSVPGVGAVVNEIRTGKPETLSRSVEQAETEKRISTALYRAFRKTLPTVVWRVAGGTAYIFGETSSQWVHGRVFTTVKRVKGVERIIDHLRIAQKTGNR